MVKIVFGVLLRQAKKFEGVSILENVLGVWVGLRQCWGHLGRAENNPLEERRIELALQIALGPPFPDCHAQVEFALFGSFALPKDDEIVRPRQLSRSEEHTSELQS